MRDRTMTHGSLFSGIGGFELGAEWAGIPTLWNCEIEDYQREVLKKNFPNVKQYRDITKTSGLGHVDIISGGFPCQDISVAGKGEGITGKRSGLWTEMHRVIREVRPAYVIIENSPALLYRGFERVLCDLSESGYMQNGNVYATRLLDSRITVKGCTLLPTPTKSDHKATFASIDALNRYLRSGHQIRMMDILAQKGFNKCQRVAIFEMVMGFPVGHTGLDLSGTP